MHFRPGIQLLLGPMFSGKTSEALRRVRRYQHAKKKVLLVKYAADQRYTKEDMMSSHDRQMLPAKSASSLLPLITSCRDVDVIAIDEGQFFPDVVEFAEQCASMGKVVIVAALDGDFRRKPFGRILELVPLAEEVIKLSAVCAECYAEAGFTLRTAANDAIELIGGAESYKPVCRTCYEESVRSARTPAYVPSPQLSKISGTESFPVSGTTTQGSEPMAEEPSDTSSPCKVAPSDDTPLYDSVNPGPVATLFR